LETPVSNVQKVSLPQPGATFESTKAVIMGWGFTNKDGIAGKILYVENFIPKNVFIIFYKCGLLAGNSPKILLKAQMETMTNEACKAKAPGKGKNNINPSVICARIVYGVPANNFF